VFLADVVYNQMRIVPTVSLALQENTLPTMDIASLVPQACLRRQKDNVNVILVHLDFNQMRTPRIVNPVQEVSALV